MKVLLVTHSYHPAFSLGGPIKSLHSINKGLVRRGNDISVLTTNTGLEENTLIPINRWLDVDGVSVKYFKHYGSRLYNISPKFVLELIKIVRDFDIVHITPVWNFPNIVAGMICKIENKKYVISPRGTLNKESFDIKNRLLKKIYYKIIAERIIKGSSAIHFTSKDEMVNVSNYLNLKNKFYVVPNGIDLNEYDNIPELGAFKKRYKTLMNNKYILYLGRIHKKKGLDILVNTFKNLINDFSHIKLVIAGFDNDGYEEKIRDMVIEKNLENKVLFTGPLYGNEIKEAFYDAECFVLPSYTENFGMAVVEAMASGCPVIVSNRVGIYDYIEQQNAGIVVKPNEESLLIGFTKLLTNSELRNTYIENGKFLVHKYFDIDNISQEMISVYDEILIS